MRAIALLLLAAACEREWVRQYDGAVPGANWDSATVLVVRDRLTGRPVPGAVVRQRPEWELGEDASWAPIVQERTTDRFGIVTFPLPEDPGNCHWTVHAEGYVPEEHYGGRAAAEIDLSRGWERAGRLLGCDGAPVAGVTVEFKRGCAHAPALLEARTNKDGVFSFTRAIDGDHCFEDPRFMADYWSGDEPRPRRFGVPTYRVWPGASLSGRVLLGNGAPPTWAVVLTNARGPRARVAADGSFALRGLPPGTPLFVWWDEGSTEFDPATLRPGGPVILQVPEAPPGAAPVPVHVRVRDEKGGTPDVATEVHFDRVADGRRFTFEWSPWGDAAAGAAVPPGAYLVSAGRPSSALVAEPRALDVSGPRGVEVVVRRQPTLRFDRSALPEETDVLCHILLEHDSWPIDDALEHDDDVFLPATARAWLRVRIWKQFEADFAIGPEHAGVREAEVRLPGRKQIRVTGLPGRYEASLLYGELVTHAVGTHWIVVDHEELGHARKRFELPWEAQDVEVRDFEFEPWAREGELRVRDARGHGVPAAEVHLLDSPWMRDWPAWDDVGTCDGQGAFRNRRLRDGVHVRIDAPGCPPLWTRLCGAPPYEIRLGGAAVQVDLSGIEGAKCVFDTVAWLDADEGGQLLLRGIAPGPHTLIVGAPGKRSLVCHLVLREGETRQIRPLLPP